MRNSQHKQAPTLENLLALTTKLTTLIQKPLLTAREHDHILLFATSIKDMTEEYLCTIPCRA